MKRKLFIALCSIFIIVACNKDKSEVGATNSSTTQGSISQKHFAGKTTGNPNGPGGASPAGSLFIPSDVANLMIGSYVSSLANDPNNTAQNPDLHSFSINADSLRAYLAYTNITNIKFIFAHTMDYINAGNQGIYAGLSSNAITIIIAGYDSSGNYVYYNGANVLDHCSPCPSNCPQGAAGVDMLQ